MRPIIIDNYCSICEESYPQNMLRRCSRCGRLYCLNCTIANLDEILCLNCARKMVTPQFKPKSKYALLSIYLAKKSVYTSKITLTFSKIEEIIGDILPPSAYNSKHWWSNTRGKTPSESWMTVGWKVESIDLVNKKVTFKKENKTIIKESPTHKKTKKRSKNAFRELTRRKRKGKSKISKTKIAKALARLQNVARAKTSSLKYKGLKPKSAYQKRLYKN